jgi:hypothetical protein
MNVIVLLLAVVVAACATAPTAETPRQANTRAALEGCNQETGGQSYDIKVDPDGRYSWRAGDNGITQSMMECMRTKGYSPQRRN